MVDNITLPPVEELVSKFFKDGYDGHRVSVTDTGVRITRLEEGDPEVEFIEVSKDDLIFSLLMRCGCVFEAWADCALSAAQNELLLGNNGGD